MNVFFKNDYIYIYIYISTVMEFWSAALHFIMILEQVTNNAGLNPYFGILCDLCQYVGTRNLTSQKTETKL